LQKHDDVIEGFDLIYINIYILNRSPATALDDIVSAELWYGKRLDVRKLKIRVHCVFAHFKGTESQKV